MTAVRCACGRACRSRSGFATHARTCTVEQARSAAFVAAVQAGTPGPWAAGERAAREERLRLLVGTLVPAAHVEQLDLDKRRWALDPTTWAWDPFDTLPGLSCASCGKADSYWGPDALDGDDCRCGSANTSRVLLDVHDRVLA